MRISVRVRPRSKIEEVAQEGDNLIVRVKEPPIEGRANRAVIRLLAKHFGVPETRIVISSGFRSRDKIVELLSATGGTQNEKRR